MPTQDTLYDRVASHQPLTNAEQMDMLELFGKRCQQRTKSILALRLGLIEDTTNHGIYRRVMVTPQVNYIAGQSWPDEVRTVRECLLNR